MATAWNEHRREILGFITEFSDAIETAIRSGASVTIDIAVEPEDRESAGPALVLPYDHEFLAALASCGARLEVSIY